MRKHELAISSDYVPNWTLVDAIRELFQNAIDTGDWFYEYEDGKLTIGNKNVSLSTQSLLLGSSSKRDDDDTIGKFGEGYKIATLVLLRLNKAVMFYNQAVGEIWYPRFVNSKRYGTKVLTFFIESDTVTGDDLLITIDGVSQREFEDIKESNLHLQDTPKMIETDLGNILLEGHKSLVYVNGLYVCAYKEYQHGYDFKPAHIELDRDRKLVSDFELKWMASAMWSAVSEEQASTIVELSEKNAADVRYVSSHRQPHKTLQDTAAMKFHRQYGDHAVPVTTQHEADIVPKAYKPIIVTESYSELIRGSSFHTDPDPLPPPKQRLRDWYEGLAPDIFTEDEQEEFEAIMEVL